MATNSTGCHISYFTFKCIKYISDVDSNLNTDLLRDEMRDKSSQFGSCPLRIDIS